MATRFVILAALAAAAFPARSGAGGCYPSYGYGYSYPSYYSYPTYYSPTYYTPTYYTPTVYVEKEVVRPYAVKAYQSPDYYYSVQDYYRDKLLVDAMAGRSVALLAQIQQLRQTANSVNLGGYTYYGVSPQQQLINQAATAGYANPYLQQGAGGNPLNPTSPPASSTYPNQGVQAGGDRGANQAAGAGVNPKLLEAVSSSCLRCHNGKDKDRMNLSDLGRLGYLERSAMLAEVARGNMPKNGKPWDKEGLALLEEYVDQSKRAGK